LEKELSINKRFEDLLGAEKNQHRVFYSLYEFENLNYFRCQKPYPIFFT